VKKAHIAIDLRIIDANTSQIVAATSVEGAATSFAAGGYTNIGGDLPIGLGGFAKTPTEKAIRVCIQKAVEYIASKTPQEYYHYNK
jgi:curli biogenesis system outer membrane secretion channel CsgG